MLCMLKALVGWAILLFLGVNFMGILLGGLANWKRFSGRSDSGFDVVDAIKRKMRWMEAISTVLMAALGALYVYLLFHWWNWMIALAGLMLMFARISDQIWEIRCEIGAVEKLEQINRLKRSLLGQFSRLFFWLSLPLIWWGLCRS